MRSSRSRAEFKNIVRALDGSRCALVEADAKNKLPELIKAVEDGEPVTICRRGVPVVDIVRTKKAPGKQLLLGTMKGKIKIIDPDWWKPMTDEEVNDFLEGR
jgi:prevent-host-death family protein